MALPDWIAGIDVGGTFTDLIAINLADGAVRLSKVPTTTDNQAYGVLAAIESAGLDLRQIGLIVHGTTTTTNALLERKLAKTGLDHHPGLPRRARTGPAHPAETLRPDRHLRAR